MPREAPYGCKADIARPAAELSDWACGHWHLKLPDQKQNWVKVKLAPKAIGRCATECCRDSGALLMPLQRAMPKLSRATVGEVLGHGLLCARRCFTTL